MPRREIIYQKIC